MRNSIESIEETRLSEQVPIPRPVAAGSTRRKGNQFAAWLGLFLIYGITTAVHSMRKFWYDELFTWHMSQQRGFAGVWAALKGGADFNPPLGYMVTKGFQFLFGNLELATRMPALFGYFIMSLCLYRFVSRRSAPAYGYVAAVCSWCSGAYMFASQARAYGLVLCFAGLALVCWQEASCDEKIQRGKRTWFLIGLCLSLAGALLSHCYAVLLLIPFTIAELVRQYHGRLFDRAMWAALLAPLGCISIYFTLHANLNSYVSKNYLFQVPWTSVPLVYGFLLVPLLWPVAISALLVAIPSWSLLASSKDLGNAETSPVVLWHEWAIAAGFAIIPACAVVLARVGSSPFFPRYGANGVIGFSLLFALFLRWRGTPHRAASMVTAVFLVCYVAAFGGYLYETLGAKPTPEAASLDGKERHKDPFEVKPDLPFVVSSALELLEIDHYAPPSVTSRLYYLTDRDAALEYTQTDGFDAGFPNLQRWFPMHAKLAPYQTFIREHQRFLLYGVYSFPTDWLIKKLIDDGADVRLIGDAEGGYGDNLLFEVIPKP